MLISDRDAIILSLKMNQMRNLTLFFLIIIIGCKEAKNTSLMSQLELQEGIDGHAAYLPSPFVAAGNRVYVVGHQDGTFPDLGWHVNGEMGGVWDHPIKLMDGYVLNVAHDSGPGWCLNDATNFRNYPVGNVHSFRNVELGISAKRFQFVPDDLEGVIVEYELINETSIERQLQVSFTGMIDLSPVWLADSLSLEDGIDKTRWNGQTITAKDSLNNWFLIYGTSKSSYQSLEPTCGTQRKGNGKDVSITSDITLKPNSTISIRYFIAGSYQDFAAAQNTYDQLKKDAKKLLASKISRFQNIAETNKLSLQDSGLVQMFRWAKFNTDWLIREVPELGRGLSAGIPDYPWWFGTDNTYIIQGLLSAGMHDEAISTINLIIKLSKERNGENGKIIHEASTNGVVYNPGNLNTTPNFITALWKAYEWTGNKSILEHYEYIKAGIAWLESQDVDGNGNPDGPGMMEIQGLHTEMIDVVVYQLKAYESAAKFARVVGDKESKDRFLEKSESLKKKINMEWWVDEFASYADFMSTKEQALELIDAAIVRADTINKPWSSTELKEIRKNVEKYNATGTQGYVVHHNWVVNTPMEMGVADPEKAAMALATAKKYSNRFGMFVTGIDRDENQEKAEKWKAFSYVGAVMTLPTGVQAIGEARYGNADEALKYLKMLENTFSYALPGSMYEVSPDFGMITQGWNIYAVAVPIVDYFIGIQPKAYEKKVLIHPNMPSDWDEVSLTKIQIGENELDISFKREGGDLIFQIHQVLFDWQIIFEAQGHFVLNGEKMESASTKGSITLSGEQNELRIIQ
ncbi:MAG: glycogen debranching enzyme [Cyclobacteriaceae bacterium]|jgi:glycogen debranching enzyme